MTACRTARIAILLCAGFCVPSWQARAESSEPSDSSSPETATSVRELLVAALGATGTRRAELLRSVKQLDDRATAALVEASGDPAPDVRALAKEVLEAQGKRTPGDAVQTTNDGVLVGVLRAYADIRDVDALPVVLSFVNSERTPVRLAARDATLAYGKDAVPKIRSTYAALTGQRLPEDVEPAQAARDLFEAYDRDRLRDVYARLDDGLAKEQAGDVDAAIADFDVVLALQPMLDRRAAMLPAYVAHAKEIESTDRAAAMDSLRRALRLAETPVQTTLVQSEIDYVDGEDLLARGIADLTPFEKAVEGDPTNVRARKELDRLRLQEQANRVRETRLATATGLAGFALIAIGLLALASRGRDS